MAEKTNAVSREAELKKLSKISMLRSFLPLIGLVVVFIIFNVLTGGRMIKNMSLVMSQIYVTLIAVLHHDHGRSGLFPGLYHGYRIHRRLHGLQSKCAACNRGRYCGRRRNRSDQRLLLC